MNHAVPRHADGDTTQRPTMVSPPVSDRSPQLQSFLRYLRQRPLLSACVLFAGLLFWLASHPPMADLPQHAGQIALLRDMLTGESAWEPLLRINLFTPYLIGYGLALPLSLLMPVAAALKVLLTLSFYAYFASCIMLRRQFGADPRLDWLFIPGFFGFATQWGLLTFLVAAPLGNIFLVLARRYAARPDMRSGARLVLMGLALFFSHGLVFLMAAAIGAAFLVGDPGARARLPRVLLPYALLTCLAGLYSLVSRADPVSLASTSPGIRWEFGWFRLVELLLFPWGFSIDAMPFAIGSLIVPALLLMYGVRLNRSDPCAPIPVLALLLAWITLPSAAMHNFLLYQRLALFMIPFAVLALRAAPAPAVTPESTRRRPSLPLQLILGAFCCCYLAQQASHLRAFEQESQDFDHVLASLAPGQRALALVLSANSDAAANPVAYLHFPLWYQAEHGGFVDVNFAWTSPPIVRFRADQVPAMNVDFAWRAKSFDWARHQGWRYRYFIVRRDAKPLPPLFAHAGCDVAVVSQAGRWIAFEAKDCAAPALTNPITTAQR